MNQECKVCGEPAAGFHFGAFTCEGCKSFFGRSYNNLSSISECKNNGECVINKKNRTSCKACRLRKCIDVGMSKSSSRYGRRSNWFKIHCLLQETRKEQKHKEPDPRLPLQIASLSRTKEEQMLLGLDDYYKQPSPSTSSPDSIADSSESFRPNDMFPLIHFPYVPRYVPIPPNLFSYFRYDDNFNRTDYSYSPSKNRSPFTDRSPTPDSPMDLSVKTMSAPEDSSDEESITVDDLPSEEEGKDLRSRDRDPLDLTTKVA